MIDRADPPKPAAEGDDETASPLWQFAVRLYSIPAVAEACLSLQDRHAADVNLILLCCWTGRHGAYLPRDQIATLEQLVSPWRIEAIAPLRRLRRQLKAAVGPVHPDQSFAFRDVIKKAELQAEKIELDTLFKALDSLPAKNAKDAERGGVIRSNLLHYLVILKVDPDEMPVRDAIELIVRESVAME